MNIDIFVFNILHDLYRWNIYVYSFLLWFFLLILSISYTCIYICVLYIIIFFYTIIYDYKHLKTKENDISFSEVNIKIQKHFYNLILILWIMIYYARYKM